MANYTSRANVILSVNGKQAQQVLSSLEKDARRLEKQMAAAASAGDKASMKKLQRELNQTNRLMDQLKGDAKSTEHVLSSLDKATPKELNKTLKQLKNELNGIERGTEAWDAHVEKIKAVKEEIRELNEEMNPDEGFWDKLNGYWEKFQLGITAAAAAVTGLVMAGKQAVNAYAEMEQEMANVQKFTGMDPDEIAELNEEFKKMDTRTSREELNQLAQEAGRLGKTSIEDVLGFVRAADKINVALDDLGDGATLTLSKLTGIFGDEDRLGTEKALLSVGSVINELSQNCSASAPYLAEFASRMGGVGAQAGLSVQQIMGFGAVLDSNNQALEASATALSQVIVRIYQDPAKYARVAGMDVEHFSNLVKTDMNAALIELLSTLKQAGGMDVLSPMFKDMGENGSRAISALSTLANNIEDVKSQQIVANEAFEEATSIDKEFDVQNNTVQAGLDKAKTRVHELAVELGEKLQPVMRLAISSSTLALKALAGIIRFCINFKTEIVAAVAAIAAYNAIMLVYNTHTAIATKSTALFNGVMKLMQGIIPAVKLLFTPLINAVQYFTNGLQVNYAMQQRWRTSMAAMKFSSWIGLITALGAAFYVVYKRISDARRAAEEARLKMAEVEKQANESAATEIQMLDTLYQKTQDQKLSIQERTKAIEKLRQIYPYYFKDISNEAFLAGKAADAYRDLRKAILDAARAKGRESMIGELEKDIQNLQMEYEEAARPWLLKKQKILGQYMLNPDKIYNDPEYVLIEHNLDILDRKYNPTINQKRKIQNELADQNTNYELNKPKEQYIADKYSHLPTSGAGNTGGNSSGSGSSRSSGNADAPADKFAAEREWREKEEALARISYAKGESDYLEHTWRMDEIAVEFCDKQLQHTDLTENERLSIEAEYYEAKKKQRERFDSDTLDAENKRYNEELANLKQFYIDGQISKETYDIKAEEAEIVHQKHMVVLSKQGSKERLQAEQQLQSLLMAQMERKQQEAEKLEKKYADMKKEYFGDNPKEAQAKYDADLALLQVVYERELAAAGNNAAEKLRIEEAFEKAKLALKKKYGLLAEEDTRNSLEKSIGDSASWLESDGGKALTGSLSTLTSGMSSIFSQLSTSIQADLEMQTAAINKRYDAEISRAEGNSYLVQKLEKEKEKEIAKAKGEANRKLFAMQVIQAVAQTAQNALNAYGSAAAIPVVGYILAPIAAAMAIAAGAIQIANIKKQQQASEAQGYQSGGFTPEGKADEVAGVVHKGEWVASQRLVYNPRTRPLLEALDYAQRTNTIGAITAADVSRTITAPAVLAAQPSAPQTVVNNTYNSAPSADNSELTSTIRELKNRLNEPFVTVNTVSGDHGILQAQDKYDRLMRNKSPKSRK